MKKIIRFFTTLTVLMTTLTFATAKNTGQIYIFESDGNGFNTKTIFYDDGKEVVAFDAQFTLAYAKQALAFIKTKTKSPVKYLVITHPNPDKFNGIPAFQEIGAKVIASKLTIANMPEVHKYKKYYFVEMAKMFTNETYPQLPTADIIFDESYTIKMANEGIVTLTELKKSGVSTNQTIAYIKAVNALVVGDLVHHKVHAWLEGPIVNGKASYNGLNWIGLLKTLKDKYPANTTIYGGRGEADKLSVSIPQQIIYLEKAEKITKNYLLTVSNNPSKVDYAALQNVFEKEFPNYTLGYMINYGAYGLVNSFK